MKLKKCKTCKKPRIIQDFIKEKETCKHCERKEIRAFKKKQEEKKRTKDERQARIAKRLLAEALKEKQDESTYDIKQTRKNIKEKNFLELKRRFENEIYNNKK